VKTYFSPEQFEKRPGEARPFLEKTMETPISFTALVQKRTGFARPFLQMFPSKSRVLLLDVE
jgi:hypothetical protein